MPTGNPHARDTMPDWLSTFVATPRAEGRAVRCRNGVHQSARVEDMCNGLLERRGLGDDLFSRHAQHIVWPIPGKHLIRRHLVSQRPRGMSPNALVKRHIQIEQMTLAATRRHEVTDHQCVACRRQNAFQHNVIALLQGEACSGADKLRRDAGRCRGVMLLQHDAPKIVLLDQRQAASVSSPNFTGDGRLAGSGVSTDDDEFARGHRDDANAVRALRPAAKSGVRAG